MAPRRALKVVVAGGGAIGASVALLLARAGAQVTLIDPAPLGANASGVAAGMLAPVFEGLFDPLARSHLALLHEARDRWPAFATGAGVRLIRDGAMAVAAPAVLDHSQALLGDQAERLSPEAARAASPGLAAGLGGLLARGDWRLEPTDALAALVRAGEAAGVTRIGAAVIGFDGVIVRLSTGESVTAERLVLAGGYAPALALIAPELAALTPVKGQILRLQGALLTGPVLRLDGAYVCPSAGGALVGATMEAGRDDLAIDAALLDRLLGVAASAVPALANAAYTASAGVRAATPDGAPLVGPSRTRGVWLAAGARRNGWLLAPLIAEIVAAGLMGEGAERAAFDPQRFSWRAG